ncbi:MAG: CDP-alcohol phosphatidyltransferase family protein [Candidatus Staskawiczbacteria bacterium]|nr:CDP-alcohol phosphatidyltransferase family protein [Candidatus Staskawiczbacteria bacterium]
MKSFIDNLGRFLEKLDRYRDELLFLFIKPYWPRKITPNYVTSVRIFIGVALFIILFFYKINDKGLILLLFCVGAITDLIDGPIARGTDKVTELGAMLDSTADRLLILPIAVYSLFDHHRWLLLVLLLVEITNTLVSIFYKSKEVYLESNIFGKTKMVLICIAFIAILIFWPNDPPILFVYMLWLTVLFSFLSMFSRLIELKQKKKIHVPQFKNL